MTDKMKATQSIRDAAMGARLLASVVQSFIADGLIDPRGKSDDQVLALAMKLVANPRAEWTSTLDHTSHLLREARKLKRCGSKEYACLFYALWVEHNLNRMVACWARRHGVGDECVSTLIRETNIRGKYAWLMLVLTGRSPVERHSQVIGRVSELRNAFVHFKWQYLNDDQVERRADQHQSCLEDVESLVDHLRRIDVKYILHGRQKLLKIIGRAPASTLKCNNS